jgi:hypothetical protein
LGRGDGQRGGVIDNLGGLRRRHEKARREAGCNQ